MEHLKQAIHRLTNHLQEVLSYMELEQYPKALQATKVAIRELRNVATALAAIVVTSKMPANSVVVVPHGTRVVSSDDVTVAVGKDEVQIVANSDVRKGHGRRNPKTR